MTAVDHYADFRDERDVALKTAAAALATLEATMDSDTATQADIDAAFAEQDTTVSAAWSSSWRKATLRFCPRPTRRTWPRRDAQRERPSRLKNPLADLFLWVAHRPSVLEDRRECRVAQAGIPEIQIEPTTRCTAGS